MRHKVIFLLQSISTDTISSSVGVDSCLTFKSSLIANMTPPPLVDLSFLKIL